MERCQLEAEKTPFADRYFRADERRLEVLLGLRTDPPAARELGGTLMLWCTKMEFAATDEQSQTLLSASKRILDTTGPSFLPEWFTWPEPFRHVMALAIAALYHLTDSQPSPDTQQQWQIALVRRQPTGLSPSS